MGLLRSIYSAVHPAYAAVRSHPKTILLLFDVKIPKGQKSHWDTTTLLLKNTLRKIVKKEDTVLEMGVGQAALLAIGVKKN